MQCLRLLDGLLWPVEWRTARCQLVDQYSNCPVVNTQIMPVLEQNLGRHVLGRPATRIPFRPRSHLPRQAKIGQFGKAVFIDKNILGFNIAIDDTALVKKLTKLLNRQT